MTVRKEYTPEAVTRNAAGDVQDKVQQMFHGDVDGAGKVHMVFFKSIGNGRQ